MMVVGSADLVFLCFVCFEEKRQPLCLECSALKRTSLSSVLDCVAPS